MISGCRLQCMQGAHSSEPEILPEELLKMMDHRSALHFLAFKYVCSILTHMRQIVKQEINLTLHFSADSLIRPLGPAVADLLDDLRDDDQNDNRDQHDINLITVISVTDRDVAQASAADKSGHR